MTDITKDPIYKKFSQNAITVLTKRYLNKNNNGELVEDISGMFRRVADNVASADAIYGKSETDIKETSDIFFNEMSNLRFIPNSPTLMNAGKTIQQLSACFVLPIKDSISDIYEQIKNAAVIHQSGGGTGFSFSNLRPKDDIVHITKGVSSGPLSFMTVFNASTEAIKQGGTRRGANMGILNVDHPDILDFITSKKDLKALNNFNISVAITDSFMEAVKNDKEYPLINPRNKEIVKYLKAKEVFDLICKTAYETGEPGIIFIDTINKYNPTPELGEIQATNPCVIGSTLISTDKGLFRISELIDNFEGVCAVSDNRVFDGNLLINGQTSDKKPDTNKNGVNFNPIKKVVNNDIKNIVLIITKNGYELSATYDHQLLTKNGWKKISDIDIDDRVLIQSGVGFKNDKINLPYNISQDFIKKANKNNVKIPTELNENLGIIFGCFIRDGKLAKQATYSKIDFKFDNNENFKIFKNIFEDTFGTGLAEIKENKILTKNLFIMDFFAKLGFGIKLPKIPNIILQSNLTFIRGFLKGLFQDFYLEKNNIYVLKEIQIILLNCGIKSYIDKNKLFIESIDTFKYNIGDIKDKFKPVDFISCKNEKFYDSVISKIPAGQAVVYDITEPETYTYITNGFVSLDCGEQPLLPYESCNLGSINLNKFVINGKIDFQSMEKTIYNAVHFLDNVIDKNKYPLKKIEDITKANRKIGLGIMGFADMLISLNIPYNSDKAVNKAEEIMSFIQKTAKKASEELAIERGAFPNSKDGKYRNATVTTIAPTGTISMIAGASSGIEPIFAISYEKTIMNGTKMLEINKAFLEKYPNAEELIINNKIPKDNIFITAHEISPEWHIKIQAAFQKFTDNAVSKTINFKNDSNINDIKKSFLLAHEYKLKGITIYRDGSREQVLSLNTNAKGTQNNKIKERKDVMQGYTFKMNTGCGSLYVTINVDENNHPFEIFNSIGKSGGCAQGQTESIGRMVSLALRSGIPLDSIILQLKGIRCNMPTGYGKNTIYSCADAIAKAIEKFSKTEIKIKENQNTTCPSCGGSNFVFSEGCSHCEDCLYSTCS